MDKQFSKNIPFMFSSINHAFKCLHVNHKQQVSSSPCSLPPRDFFYFNIKYCKPLIQKEKFRQKLLSQTPFQNCCLAWHNIQQFILVQQFWKIFQPGQVSVNISELRQIIHGLEIYQHIFVMVWHFQQTSVFHNSSCILHFRKLLPC